MQVQEMQLSQLKSWDDNPRLNDQAVSSVAQSIRAFGFNVPILCDQNLWDIPAVTNQLETYGHPAVCLVEIPYRCLQAYTDSGATVLEPFGGSGTTLIAAEKASRRAFVVERNPAYCDLIVQRWENLTGGKAQRRGSVS